MHRLGAGLAECSHELEQHVSCLTLIRTLSWNAVHEQKLELRVDQPCALGGYLPERVARKRRNDHQCGSCNRAGTVLSCQLDDVLTEMCSGSSEHNAQNKCVVNRNPLCNPPPVPGSLEGIGRIRLEEWNQMHHVAEWDDVQLTW